MARNGDTSNAEKRRVTSAQINFVLNSVAFAILVFLASSGLLLHVSLPHGSGGITIWGMTRHEWGDLHLVLALTFLGVMAVHLVLHWRWITCMIKGKQKTRATSKIGSLFAVLFILALLAFAVAPFFANQGSDGRGQGHGGGWHGGR